MMWHIDFRAFQALADLKQVQKQLGPEAILPITRGNATHLTELADHLHASPFSTDSELSKPVMDAVWAAAVSPDGDNSAFLCATSIALQRTIRTGENTPFMMDLFDDHSDSYRTNSPQIRAALMNGFDQMQRLHAPTVSRKIAAKDLQTHPFRSVESLLIPLAKAMTEEEIDHVARADYGYDFNHYKADLIDLLQRPDLSSRPYEDRLFPIEVVMLVSYVPHEPGHLPCTALILLDAIRHSDDFDSAHFRYQQQWRTYKRLPLPSRTAFNAAFRYLYETDEYWNPSFEPFPKIDSFHDIALDWNDLPKA